MVDIHEVAVAAATPALTLFEKIFNPLKQYKDYQLDKVNFHNLSNQAHEKLVDLAQVRTINEFDRSVSLYDFYVPPQVTGIESKNTFTVRSLNDFFTPKKILISGIVGQGKSILMKNLAIQESYKCEKFPIFIELRDLDENENLEKFVGRSICDLLGLESSKLHSYLLKEGKVILFFDGFDEVKTNEMGRVVKEFERFEKKFPNLKFIVSSRPEDTIEKSTIFSKFIINKLDLDGQINIIEKLTDQVFLKKNLIDNLKKSNKDIQGVLVTPLMVNFYYYLYKTEQIKGTDVTLFYNQLFDLTLRKHDGTKLIYERTYVTGLNPKELQSVFECICFISCTQKTFFFTEYKFREIVTKAINFENLSCNKDDLIRDLTTGISFICREGESFAYLHTSIAEFFGAKFIINNINSLNLINRIVDNYEDYINLVEYMKEINNKFFLLYFLKPVIEKSKDFFKNKLILDNIYISSKFYDKKGSKDNVLYVLIVFSSEVHSYIVFDFKNYIKPFIREHLIKKYNKKFRIKYQYFWKPTEQASNSNDEVIQSENYFLHERIDNENKSNTESTNRKALKSRIEMDEFKSINLNYANRAPIIEKAINSYLIKLDSLETKIKMNENTDIEDLFG